jgi:hypothetical protein
MAETQSITTTLSRAKTVGRPENYYPSPFFDLAQTYMPANIKDTFEWCAYYYQTNPIINGVVTKLSSYAITDLLYGDPVESSTFKKLFEGPLNLRTFLVEFGLDRNCFGNAFASVVFPFKKILGCRSCGKLIEATKADYTFRSGKFILKCANCKFEGEARAKDETIPAANQIRLKRWSPRQITIRTNESTGECRYFYSLSRSARNEILLGNRKTLESTPQAFIDAVHGNKLIELDPTKLFHSRRPSISRDITDAGWGTPLILPVLKDIFLLQVLKKSQEVVAMEYILPFRSLYPEVRADGNNVYGQVNLTAWQNSVKREITQWKKDPGHIAVFPVPIGQQVMGGQGRSMLLHQEVRVYSDQIIAGMGVPTGFYYGEALYSGASVNLRAMENEFLAYRQDMQHLVEFFVKSIAYGLSIQPIDVKFREFKMADDLARAGMEFNMANAGRLSWRTFLSSRGFDYDHENKLIIKELSDAAEKNKINAKAQAAVQAMMGQEQAKSQSATQRLMARLQGAAPQAAPPPGQPGQPPEAGPPQQGATQSPQQEASGIAQQLAQMPEVQRYQTLARMRQENPDLYQMVNTMLQGGGPQPGQQLPEQLPPRAEGFNRQL